MKMILFIECIIGCILFGIGIVGSVLINKEFWLQEYDPSVKNRYLSLHPEYRPADATSSTVSTIIKKIIACLSCKLEKGETFRHGGHGQGIQV